MLYFSLLSSDQLFPVGFLPLPSWTSYFDSLWLCSHSSLIVSQAVQHRVRKEVILGFGLLCVLPAGLRRHPLER